MVGGLLFHWQRLAFIHFYLSSSFLATNEDLRLLQVPAERRTNCCCLERVVCSEQMARCLSLTLSELIEMVALCSLKNRVHDSTGFSNNFSVLELRQRK